ncbi:MAG: hypothetical protein U0R18_01810 [Mycobacterium sp.]
MADSVIWIVIAVAVVLVLLGVALVARNRRHTRLHGQAQRIREEVEQQSVHVDRRDALAQETAARARAARAEAEVKDAEATRLEERAGVHRQAAAAGRDELDARLGHADTIDPTVKVSDGTGPDDVTRVERR